MTRIHSARDVAAAFGVAPVTVRLWANQGRIPCSKTLGGHRRFDLDEVRRAFDHHHDLLDGGGAARPTTPADRYSAVATAVRIDERLHSSEHATGERDFREDAALRAVIDLRDTLRRASPERFSRLVVVPPGLTGDSRWDAFVAAVVEDEGARKGVPVPRWTGDPRRFTKPFWYLSGIKGQHSWELAHAHGSFIRHGVVAADEDLESV